MDIRKAPQRKHNKSGSELLSLLTFPHPCKKLAFRSFEEQLKAAYAAMETALKNAKEVQGILAGSACRVLRAADGRLSIHGAKVCYGYQVAALKRYGIDTLRTVASNKTAVDLTISHLCGTRNCCNSDHLYLEEKSINDTRTHCHEVLKTVLLKSGSTGLERFLSEWAGLFCDHNPCCGLLPSSPISPQASQALAAASQQEGEGIGEEEEEEEEEEQ